jgi:lysophospholipase L1-like esterase
MNRKETNNTIFATVLIALLTLSFTLSNAQTVYPYPHHFPHYPFIQYDSNQVYFISDSLPWQQFFNKLDSVYFFGKGQVNILQMGGSHIQADIWSSRLRRNFQTLMPGCDAGRGLIFPMKIAKTNNPYSFDVKYTGQWDKCKNVEKDKNCTLGLTGMQVFTHDTTATITIYFRTREYEYLNYPFNHVKLFYDIDTTSFDIELTNLPPDQYTVKLNPELGYQEFIFNRYIDTISFRLVKHDSCQQKFTLYGLTLESDLPGIYYHGVGVNGASVPSYLRCNELEKQLSVIKPDLVIFSIGINDAYMTQSEFKPEEFYQNYDTLIKRILAVSPNTAILFTNNNDSYYKRRYPNKNVFYVRKQMKLLAAKYNAGFWDMFQVMGGLGSIYSWQQAALAKKDKIHLTTEGYKLMGDLLFSAILKKYEIHLKQLAQ